MWNMWLYYTIQGDEITLHNSVYNCDSLVSIWRVFICSKMKPIVWPLITSRCCWRACILTFASSSCACSSAFSADSVSLAWNGTVRAHECRYNTHVHVHTHARMHVHMHTCTHARMHTRTHARTYTHAHMYTHTYTYTHTHTHVHTHTHLFCSC